PTPPRTTFPYTTPFRSHASRLAKLPAPATSISRRVHRIGSPPFQRLQFPVPRRAIRPHQHPRRLGVPDNFFPRRVPAQPSAQPRSEEHTSELQSPDHLV